MYSFYSNIAAASDVDSCTSFRNRTYSALPAQAGLAFRPGVLYAVLRALYKTVLHIFYRGDRMSVLLWVLAAAALIVFLKLITAPIRLIWKILLNLFFGAVCLVLVNLIGCAIGFQIGISVFSAAVVGVLGLPGVLLLLALQWLL